MKTRILQAGLTLGLVCSASASVLQYYNGTGGIIPDGSESGLMQTIISSDPGVVIADVSVVLNISGGFNGDLFGYLTYDDGVTERTMILLDRIGGGSLAAAGSGFGTGAATTDYASLLLVGVNLTDAASGNIHDVTPGAGNYVPAGNYIADSDVTFASTFVGMAASGTWSLLLFDRSAGDESELISWGLQVVPEPTTWAAIVFGTVFAGVQIGRRVQKRKVA